MKIRHSEDYRKRRRAEYPPVGEQMDAIMKMAAALREQGIALPEETQQWIDHCQSVKMKYRKCYPD